MWYYPTEYDVIVIGAGHAGCEAAHAAAKIGSHVLLLTINLDTIAKMSCNPSIGGTAKGHIVREIDALGGIMGKIADKTGIHFRMLNSSKGPAVRSPRAQIDKSAYSQEVKLLLEETPNLDIKQAKVEKILINNGKVHGVCTNDKTVFLCKTLVITCGTFLQGLIHIGKTHFSGGRIAEESSDTLSFSLKDLGFSLGKLKTGTPPRIHSRDIDYSQTEEQQGEQNVRFSYDPNKDFALLPQKSCHITYTTEETKKIILADLDKSPLFSGIIKGVGPRYCPSIEDKIIRFSDKERHQLFLEPEGVKTKEIYINGLSSSLPYDTQIKILRSIPCLKKAEILRPAYAIEYDYITSDQIYSSLETKKVENLFFAGQINGTTGYEEAGAQGLIAGINAANKSLGKKPFILSRSESYIGVMIDDLISKELDEPYRMFTSRAEYRLLLRQDNADIRLREYGYLLGLINLEQYERVKEKKDIIEKEIKRLGNIYKSYEGKKVSLAQFLCRPEIFYSQSLIDFPEYVIDHGKEINEQIEIALKFAGYIRRQEKEINKLQNLEKITIPRDFCYKNVIGLRNEAREKLIRFTPENLSIALRLSGISPADISILLIALEKNALDKIPLC
jgi:tRNA uridine 5-carboxymethylaminomethyl modification enzyme